MALLRNVVLVAFVVVFIAFGCRSVAQENKERLSAAELQDDLEQFRGIIESKHPQLYRFNSAEYFDSLFEAAENSFHDDMKIEDAFPHFSKIIASIGCGHSQISVPQWFWTDKNSGYFPFQIHLANEVLFVTSSLTDDNNVPPASEISEINGQAVLEILNQLRSYTPGDGLWNSRRDWFIVQYFPWRIAAMFDFPNDYHITFKRPDSDSSENVTIEAARYNQLRSPSSTGKDFELKTDLEGKTALLRIRTFGYYDHVDAFKEYMDDAFMKIRNSKADNLILDLRGNSGGDPHCSTHLFSYLIPKPLPYFGEKFFGYQKYADPLPVFENRFKGKLYVLIDGGCFSTTGHFIGLLKYHNLATFVGQESGATYTCNDASMEFSLKHSGFNGRIAQRTYYTAVEGISWSEGIQPDHLVIPSATDVIEGKDAVLDSSLQIIHNSYRR